MWAVPFFCSVCAGWLLPMPGQDLPGQELPQGVKELPGQELPGKELPQGVKELHVLHFVGAAAWGCYTL